MNWEGVSTIAEVVGAIAVVLTLIYVAIQIKQNTAASRAQSINQINGDAVEFLAPTVQRLLASPAAIHWWKEESRNLYVAELCNSVNRIADLSYDPVPE